MKIVIVEDEIIIADYIRSIIERNGHECILITDNYKDAIKSLNHSPDLFLLDINLDGLNSGLMIAEELNTFNVPYAFITANNKTEILKEAIECKPLAYLTKPIKENDIIAAISLYSMKQEPNLFEIKLTNDKRIIVKSKDILYCKAQGSYTVFAMHESEYSQRSNLNEVNQLLGDNFIRVHRSYIINSEHIKSYSKTDVTIADVVIPLSRKYKENLETYLRLNKIGNTN